MAAPTKKELAALEIFKKRISDIELNEFLSKDMHLLRWLRARELNVDKAEEMIRKSMIWRKENDVDSALTTWEFPKIVEECLPWRCSGFDSEGSPIIIINFGKWDIRKVLDAGYRKDFILGSYFCNEWELSLMKYKSTNERTVSQAIQIIDLEGYSLRQFASKQVVDAFLEQILHMEDNYPEILKVVYVVNAPRVFTILFSLIKPLLSAQTLAKVKLHGTNTADWRRELLNCIPADHLPSELGGTNTTCKNVTDLDPASVGPKFEELQQSEFINAVVEAGSILKINLEVNHANSKMSWAFQTKEYDIGFSLHFENDEELVNCPRCDSHLNTQKGSIICQKAGKYIMSFNNSYSRLREKMVAYAVLIKPEDS